MSTMTLTFHCISRGKSFKPLWSHAAPVQDSPARRDPVCFDCKIKINFNFDSTRNLGLSSRRWAPIRWLIKFVDTVNFYSSTG